VTWVSIRPDPSPDAQRFTLHRPADISRELVTLLRTHGLAHLYWSASARIGVISITPELTIWTDGRHLTWTRHGTRTTLPADDTTEAATHLARLAKQPTGDTP
jgi:hypothetical protein